MNTTTTAVLLAACMLTVGLASMPVNADGQNCAAAINKLKLDMPASIDVTNPKYDNNDIQQVKIQCPDIGKEPPSLGNFGAGECLVVDGVTFECASGTGAAYNFGSKAALCGYASTPPAYCYDFTAQGDGYALLGYQAGSFILHGGWAGSKACNFDPTGNCHAESEGHALAYSGPDCNTVSGETLSVWGSWTSTPYAVNCG